MNKLLKKAITLILCLTFTFGLMSIANANEVGDETFNGEAAEKKVTIYMDLPSNVTREVSLKVYVNGVLDANHSKTLIPAYNTTYTLTVSGASGKKSVVMNLDNKKYREYEIDFDSSEVETKASSIYNKLHELCKARDEFLKVVIEEAKEKVCENLKISRELLDEVTKNVEIEATFGEKTEYIPGKKLILVGVWNMMLDEHPSGANKGSNLAREIAFAFIDNYLYPDREDLLLREGIINAFADLCDKNIIPNNKMRSMPINLNEICCDRKQAGKIIKNEERRNLKYLAQKWLSEGNVTPLEVLDKIKAGENAKDILLKTGGIKAFDDWIKENTITETIDDAKQ